MSGPPKLPDWTSTHTDEGWIYEAVDSRGRMWRLWPVASATPDNPIPSEWRFAPVDALDHINVIEHVGGGREFDTAASLIDMGEVAGDPGFRYRMDRGEPSE